MTAPGETAAGEASPGVWIAGPAEPRLPDGIVDVWRADLEAAPDEFGDLLSDEEQARATRFLRERDRVLWKRSRGVLRALLGRYLQQEPSKLRFATDTHGKPSLMRDASTSSNQRKPAASQEHPRLSFNLSHSDALALYAVTEIGSVGVDIEVARRPMNELAVASRILGPAQARRLEGLDSVNREREFLRLWARHEAKLKCRGTGIGGGPPGNRAPTSGDELWVAELDVGSRAAAALALERQPRALLLGLAGLSAR